MARTASARLHALASAFSPALVGMMVSTVVPGMWTVSQPPAPALAYHKYYDQPFLRWLRNDAVSEVYCTSRLYAPSYSWSRVSGPINYALLNEYGVDSQWPWSTRWHYLASGGIYMLADKLYPCESPNSQYGAGSTKIFYWTATDPNAVAGCGGYFWDSWLQTNVQAGCALERRSTYQYSICWPSRSNCQWRGNAYDRFDVYLDERRLVGALYFRGNSYYDPNQQRNYYLGTTDVHHVNHETGHVFGLADPQPPPYQTCEYSVMHQSVRYNCPTNWTWPTTDSNWQMSHGLNDIGGVRAIYDISDSETFYSPP